MSHQGTILQQIAAISMPAAASSPSVVQPFPVQFMSKSFKSRWKSSEFVRCQQPVATYPAGQNEALPSLGQSRTRREG